MEIKSKDHYDRVCKERNFVSDEQCKEIAEKARKEKIKPYKISEKSLAIINSASQRADKNGNVKLSDRTIDALIANKAIGKKIPDYMKLPQVYDKGGFSS